MVIKQGSFWLGDVGLCPPSPHSAGIPLWLGSVQDLCILSQTLWAHRYTSPVVSRRPCFIGVFHPYWLLESFCLFFCRVSWVSPGRRDFVKTSHLRLSFPRSLSAVSSCGSLYLFPSAAGGSFLDADWAKHWYRSIAEGCEESFYCYTPLYNSSLGVSLRCIAYLRETPKLLLYRGV